MSRIIRRAISALLLWNLVRLVVRTLLRILEGPVKKSAAFVSRNISFPSFQEVASEKMKAIAASSERNSGSERIATLLAQAGCEVETSTGALTPPIHLSTTFERDKDLNYSRRFVYIREANPTRNLLERTVAAAENGDEAAAFASGSAAAAAIFQALPKGHVIFPDDLYHGNRTMLYNVFEPWGLKITPIDMTNLDLLESTLDATLENTRTELVLVWTETPSNPLLKVSDLKSMAKICNKRRVVLCVDSTWMTPSICRPIDHGADLVLHSTTKFLGGHSDVLGGAVVRSNSGQATELFKRVRQSQFTVGAVSAPFDCWLVLRGMRSLSCRMLAHCHNAMTLATFLDDHPNVAEVFYPGLEKHPGHEIHKDLVQGKMFGGMLSFRVKGGKDAAVRFVSSVKIAKRATSLGGTETLVEHRSSIEGPLSETPKDLVRVSVGLEDSRDILQDFDQALFESQSN